MNREVEGDADRKARGDQGRDEKSPLFEGEPSVGGRSGSTIVEKRRERGLSALDTTPKAFVVSEPESGGT